MKFNLFFYLVSMVWFKWGICNDMELETVQVVFRHGERTYNYLEQPFIREPELNLQEPWGYGQLTNRGKQQEYRIGKMLRKRYDKFLGDVCRAEEVSARSSDYDRTKTSLQLVLAALYPPTSKLIWNERLRWSPIPINFMPRSLDYLFKQEACQAYKDKYKMLLNTDEVMKKMDEYQDLFDLFTRIYPERKIDLLTLFLLNNYVTIQKSLHGPLPDWYTAKRHLKLIKAAKFYLDTLLYTPELTRGFIGALVRQIADNINVDGTSNIPRKLYLYSGHEYTVYAVAKAHGITLPESPHYGSALIIEKLRDRDNQIFVRLYLWTGTTEQLVLIELPDCGEFCPLEKYLKIVESSLASDEDLRCLLTNMTSKDLMKVFNDIALPQ